MYTIDNLHANIMHVQDCEQYLTIISTYREEMNKFSMSQSKSLSLSCLSSHDMDASVYTNVIMKSSWKGYTLIDFKFGCITDLFDRDYGNRGRQRPSTLDNYYNPIQRSDALPIKTPTAGRQHRKKSSGSSRWMRWNKEKLHSHIETLVRSHYMKASAPQ